MSSYDIDRNPFLDIATSVTDASSPLTIHEYDEWGHVGVGDNVNSLTQTQRNGNESAETDNAHRQALKVIRSYSPCDNISDMVIKDGDSGIRKLPSVLITVGLQDDKVDPGEAFKWMTLLREKYKEVELLQNGSSTCATLLLNIRNEGHEGAATVEEQCEVAAIEMAFLEKEIENT